MVCQKHVLRLSKEDLKELEEIFRSKVLALLKAEGKINDGLIEELMAWHHSGFSVHAENRLVPCLISFVPNNGKIKIALE